MSPELLYWIVLAALVVPSIPFNRVAVIVALVWGFGHVVYRLGPYDDAALMFARIVAIGGALALSMPHDATLKSKARLATALLFIPAAFLSGLAGVFSHQPPITMQDYHLQTAIYWTTWTVIMVQAITIPFGNNWSAAIRVGKKADEWLMRIIVKRFGNAL